MTIPATSDDLKAYLRRQLGPNADEVLLDCLAVAILRRHAEAPELAEAEMHKLLGLLYADLMLHRAS
ncbi:hypothetical protein KM176_05810 [Pseudooceanicola sp. CBS1P-1]|uniref:Uncharacterized protein n=1 Tax=Pseudooceanicola albus TaxID=2692189 RepID=A0A6L7FYH6_9RHOB|nr:MULTISPECIES: hypothetical protein [Pseudooceanicola]MBT9383369.1 hypothetical protein [Pseudooceanicola endophyticus]MXN16308.1 hypothetical protein [Pseudooceanicola albus]